MLVMSKEATRFLLILLWLACAGLTRAQAPTGSIAGIVTDPAGLPVPAAHVSIVNRATGLPRALVTSREGTFSAPALPSGIYRVTTEATGFRSSELAAAVEAGTTTTVDIALKLGPMNETVTVGDAVPLLRYDHHEVAGLVSRTQIENLPLNGRDYLGLATLEPGGGDIRSTGTQTFVSILGSGTQSYPRIGHVRMTLDGASIMGISRPGAVLNASQDVVDEFHLSSVNMDLSTGLASGGAINIVTRSGGNDYHGGGFLLYRDHNLAAYPGLRRDSTNPDPYFQRRQWGFHAGGPIRRDRAFFFTSYERNDQRGVDSIQPGTPEFSPHGGIFPTPFTGNLFNLRLDSRLSAMNHAFVRYTHDGSRLFTNEGSRGVLPSGWVRTSHWVDQSLLGLTSVLSPRLVSDFRFSYFFMSVPDRTVTNEDCTHCLGIGAPRIMIPDAGVTLGLAPRGSSIGRQFQTTESLSFETGSHRLRLGVDWEHSAVSAQSVNQEPAEITLYSPGEVRRFNDRVPASERLVLPPSFLTLDDILQLPLKSFKASVGPSLFLNRGFQKKRILDSYRLFASDTWRVGRSLTVNYGFALSYEPNSFRADLTKPAFLDALLGSNALNPPPARADVSPSLGLAWATRDGKTVIRAGAGRYVDPVIVNVNNVVSERRALAPSGTGRRSIPGSGITYQGARLEFVQNPTAFTAAHLIAILPGIRADLEKRLNPDNRDFTYRNLNLDKTGAGLSDPSLRPAYALHFNLGVQHQLAPNLVLAADFAFRRFLHTALLGIDYNRFNRRPGGPVIPRCTAGQSDDLTAVCSNGPITFDNTSGIATFRGLILRLEKRYARGTQLLASYALAGYAGTNGPPGPAQTSSGFNNDDWFENYGPLPTDRRHTLSVSGCMDLPWQVGVSFIVSASSRPPFFAYVNGIDFNGDGTQHDLLPGSRMNQFNRGLERRDLEAMVNRYNAQIAHTRTVSGQIAPPLTLPPRYSFNDGFFTQDLRVSRAFSLAGEQTRLVIFGEVFNLLNIANLVQYGNNISNPAEFAQPGARFTQVFGSGGPRAFQVGIKASF
jgi:hypothetical protein